MDQEMPHDHFDRMFIKELDDQVICAAICSNFFAELSFDRNLIIKDERTLWFVLK